MFKLYSILSFMALICFASHSYGKIIVVDVLSDSGSGSFREASTLAVSNDTILINVKGTITLASSILFSSISNITIIGPYAKHNAFKADGSWTGSFFTFLECDSITIKNLGFDSGNTYNRHISFTGGSHNIVEHCLFQNNSVTSVSIIGSALLFDNSDGKVKSCSFNNNKCSKGTVAMEGSSIVTIENCTFSSNTATSKAAAIFGTGSVQITLLYNTIVHNISSGAPPEAILIAGSSSLKLENNAIGHNIGGRQIQRIGSSSISSNGGNIIKLNSFSESTGISTLFTGDYFSTSADFGLRSEIKIDGFGLKYWPIVESSSDLINPAEKTDFTPELDCRNAPRCLKGPSSTVADPDAGACEYTHLRVTNNSGIASDINSFLWALESEQRKDSIHYIEFDILGGATEIVFLDTAEISEKIYFIDGFSQDESAIPGPHQIDSFGVTGAKNSIIFKGGDDYRIGIKFNSGSKHSVLQGVRIISFDRHGIVVAATNISVFGCEIGIDSLGDSFENKRTGIIIREDSTKIGGWEHWQRNVISGNGQSSLEFRKSNIFIQIGSNIIIQGNIIGGASNGVDTITDPLRTEFGIHSLTNNNTIGGSLINSGNYILNNQYGVYLNHTSNINTIQGNNIGVGWDSYTTLGNSITGIFLAGSDNNLIGGEDSLMANHIAFNLTGIALSENTNTSLNNRILGNSIHSNIQQGIDLENDGLVILNDTATFPLLQQNSGLDYPVLIHSENCTGPTTLTEYELFVPSGEEYRVEFFSNTSPDSTNGEGETFLGFQNVTPSSMPEIFTYDHGEVLLDGTHLSATVTQINTMTTSEFGTNVDVGSILLDIGFSYDPICPGESVAPIYDVYSGGTFRFSDPAPVDGVDLDPLTGVISTPVEGATYTIIYSVSGACLIEDTTTVTIITVDETFSFPDICATPFSPMPIMDGDTGTFSFFPIPVDGADIGLETGIISNPVEYATYTVIHTLSNLGCTQSDTAIVSVIGIEEGFTFEDVCFGTIGLPSDIETDIGDIFLIVDPPDTDVSIDSETGALSNGVLGTAYTIRHIVGDGICIDSMDIVVTIIEANSSFTFPNFCPGLDSPLPTKDTDDGTFSFFDPPGDDELIDGDTGIISNSAEGETYTVIYTVVEESCINSDTIEVSVYLVYEDFIFDDFCWDGSDSPPAAGYLPGGSFYFAVSPGDDAEINGDTGSILSPTEFTSYEIVHTLTTSDMCTQDDTITVTAIGVDEGFVFPDFCPGTDGLPTSIETSGGEFEFNVVPVDTPSLDTITGMISSAIEGAVYVLKYTVFDISGLCSQSSIDTIHVISIDESFSFDNFCAEFSGLPSDFDLSDGGSFLFAPDLGDDANIDLTTGEITTAVPGTTYTIEYTVGVCAERDTVNVIALASDIADFTLNDYCSNLPQSAEILGTLEGSFDFSPLPMDDAIINLSTGTITNSTGGVYAVRYLTTGSDTTCADTIIKTVTLFETPSVSLYTEINLYCPNDELVYIVATEITSTEKVYWYLDIIESEIIDSTFNFLPDFLSIGENIFYAQAKSTDGCFGNPEKYTLTLSDTTGMHAISDPLICMGSPAYLEAYGGTFYEWYTDIPLSDNNSPIQSAFSLNEEDYIVSIKNKDNCEVLDTVHVRFLPRHECQINVYNAFSPNNDGKNDFWYIENLINFLPNTVFIYNRWGDEVNQMNNYDNMTVFWDGTDKQGKALPPNTYFYVVISDDSESNQAGWVQLVR